MSDGADDADGTFPIDGVTCKIENEWKVRVGMNLPAKYRFPVKVRNDETPEQAVRRHAKLPAAVQALLGVTISSGA